MRPVLVSGSYFWWGALPFSCGIVFDLVSMPSPSPSHDARWNSTPTSLYSSNSVYSHSQVKSQCWATSHSPQPSHIQPWLAFASMPRLMTFFPAQKGNYWYHSISFNMLHQITAQSNFNGILKKIEYSMVFYLPLPSPMHFPLGFSSRGT